MEIAEKSIKNIVKFDKIAGKNIRRAQQTLKAVCRAVAFDPKQEIKRRRKKHSRDILYFEDLPILENYIKNSDNLSESEKNKYLEKISGIGRILTKNAEKLCRENLSFVKHLLPPFLKKGASYEELLNYGADGLMQAALGYDPDAGCKFITYAAWWIRQAFQKAIRERKRVSGKPKHNDAFLKAEKELAQELGRAPSLDEIAQRASLSREQIDNLIMVYYFENIPIDSPLPNGSDDADGGLIVSDCIKDPNAEMKMINSIYLPQLNKILKEIMAKNLSEEELEIMKLRFPLDGEERATLEETGEILSLSRERIRQIENDIKERLRQNKEILALLN